MSRKANVIPFKEPEETSSFALRIDGVCLTHEGRNLLSDISFEIASTGITGLVGPNGAGKSLLLRVATGLLQTTKGNVSFSKNFDNPSLVFQRPVLLRRSVSANLRHALKVAGVPRSERSGKLAELLVAAGLTKLAESPARKLSGGEQQRLAIVRALASDPKLLLLDEPTASLDPAATLAIEDLVRITAAAGVKIVIVTHNRAQAARLCDDILFLHQGRILEHTATDSFFRAPKSEIARAYLDGKLVI